MNTDVGAIHLILEPRYCNTEAIERILATAEHDEPGEPTLRLVGYDGHTSAKLAMVQPNVPGERMRLIRKLLEIPGVVTAG